MKNEKNLDEIITLNPDRIYSGCYCVDCKHLKKDYYSGVYDNHYEPKCAKTGKEIYNHPDSNYGITHYTPATCPKNPAVKGMSKEEIEYRDFLYQQGNFDQKWGGPLKEIRNYVKQLENRS